jgi:hypothetical protein
MQIPDIFRYIIISFQRLISRSPPYPPIFRLLSVSNTYFSAFLNGHFNQISSWKPCLIKVADSLFKFLSHNLHGLIESLLRVRILVIPYRITMWNAGIQCAGQLISGCGFKLIMSPLTAYRYLYLCSLGGTFSLFFIIYYSTPLTSACATQTENLMVLKVTFYKFRAKTIKSNILYFGKDEKSAI